MAERRNLVFPILADGQKLDVDNRVIMTNNQLITRNPSPHDEANFNLPSNRDNKQNKTEEANNNGHRVNLSKSNRRAFEQTKPFNPQTTYQSQHRPLNSDHSGANGFDKAPRRTKIEEAKDRAKRAYVAPERPKGYVHPLEREKEHFSTKKAATATLNNKQGKDAKNSMNATDAKKKAQTSPAQKNSEKSSKDYFERKRETIFERGERGLGIS